MHSPICEFFISQKSVHKSGFVHKTSVVHKSSFVHKSEYALFLIVVTSESRFSMLCVNYHAFTYFEYSSTTNKASNRATNYRASIICVFAHNM